MSVGNWIFLAFLLVLAGTLFYGARRKKKTAMSSGAAVDFTKRGKLPEDDDYGA